MLPPSFKKAKLFKIQEGQLSPRVPKKLKQQQQKQTIIEKSHSNIK